MLMPSPLGLERVGVPIFFQNIGFPQRSQATALPKSRWTLSGVGIASHYLVGLGWYYSNVALASQERKAELSNTKAPPTSFFQGCLWGLGDISGSYRVVEVAGGGRLVFSAAICLLSTQETSLSPCGVWLSISTDHCWSASFQPHGLISSEAFCKP